MLRRIFISVCIMAVLGSGCGQTTVTPVTVVQQLATNTSTSRPTPTKTLTPRSTVMLVGDPTLQAASRLEFHTRTPSRTPTITRTFTRTPTPEPVASLVAHKWTTGPVLLQFGGFGGDGGPELPRALHKYVLYADGRLILSRWNWDSSSWPLQGEILEHRLSRHEICALLNTIDQTGFFDYDPSAYLPEGQWFPFDGSSTTIIEVNAWRKKEVSLYGLWHFVDQNPPLTWSVVDCEYCAPPPFITLALSQTYRLLSQYRPEKFTPYTPERLGVWIELNEQPVTDADQLWPLESPSLSKIYARSIDKGEMYGHSVVVNGEDAVRVYQMFDNTLFDSFESDRIFVEDGRKYSVFVRPLFPYEVMPDYRGEAGRIPDPSIPAPAITLACTPKDGTLPIP
jgi:hypothetical protein